MATRYVAPTGSNTATGTISDPWATLAYAHAQIAGGDTIYLRGGTYNTTSWINITKSGTQAAPTQILAYPGEVPVLDGAAMTSTGYYDGWVLVLTNANWVEIKGIEVTNGPMGGVILMGTSSNNTIERCTTHHNGRLADWEGTGLTLEDTAANNLILNCDSYRNQDIQLANADGFRATSDGAGNVFRGCRAWRNSDDGYDGYNSPGSTFEDCWSWKNGFDDNDNRLGDGNGFKLGGGATSGGHTVIRCMAWGNPGDGFGDNDANIPSTLYNNTAWSNGYNFSYWIPQQNVFRNNISYQSTNTIGITGDDANNSWTLPVTITNADFVSLDEATAIGPRGADGALPDTDFLRLAQSSDLVEAGLDVGLPYEGAKPDLGARAHTGTVEPPPQDVVVGASAWAGANTPLTATITHPAGIQAGDLIAIFGFFRYATNAVPVDPTGFTRQVLSANGGTGTNGLRTGTSKAGVWTKVADGTETTTQFTCSGGNNFQVVSVVFRGIDTIAAASGVDTSLDTAYAATTGGLDIAAGDVVIAVAGVATSVMVFSGKTFAASGITFSTVTEDKPDSPFGAGAHQTAGLARATVDTGGGTVPVTYSMTLSAAQAGAMALLRLRPLAVPANTTTGQLPIAVPLTGTAATVEMRTTTGQLSISVTLLPAAVVPVTTTGSSLPTVVTLTANTVPVKASAGVLPLTITLTATAVPVKRATGALSASSGLQGSASKTATTTGALNAVGGLTSTAAPVKTTSSSLPVQAGLTSRSVSVKTATGTLNTTAGLNAAPSVATRTSTATLPVTAGLTGLPSGATEVHTTAGTLSTTAGLTVAAVPVKTASCIASVTAGLAGTQTSVKPSTGQLAVTSGFSGTATGATKSVTAGLPVTAGLTGLPSGATETKTTSGALPILVRLTSIAAPAGATAGALRVGDGITGTPIPVKTTAGVPLSVVTDLTGAAAQVRQTTAQLPVTVGLTSDTNTTRTTAAALSAGVALQATVTGTLQILTASGVLPVMVRLGATGIATRVSAGSLATFAGIAAGTVAVLTVDGALPVDVRVRADMLASGPPPRSRTIVTPPQSRTLVTY